jgi:hypothetical protein
MFKLFRSTEFKADDVDWELDVHPILPEVDMDHKELTLSESYEVILDRLNKIEEKIDKILKDK